MLLFRIERTMLAAALYALSSLCVVATATAQEPAQATQGPSDTILALTRDSRMPTATVILDMLGPAAPSETIALLAALGDSRLLPESTMRSMLIATLELVPSVALDRKRAHKSEKGDAQCALTILRELGDHDDVKTLLEIVAPAPDATELHPVTARTLRSCLGQVLERDERAYMMIERQYERVHDALAPTLIATVGDRRSLPGLGVLLNWLDHGRVHERLVLSHINRTAAKLEPVLSDHSLMRVRLLLGSADEAVRREAALAVGRLNDFDSLPELIEMMQVDTRPVRANAHWSLKHMTKLGMRPNRWIGWYQAECSWWRDDAPALLNTLSLNSPADLVPAINEISHHRLYRRELAIELIQLLHHPDPSIVRLTCSALECLQSKTAAKAIVPLVDHPDEAVRDQACAALRKITGKSLPCERSAWEQAVL